MPSAQLAHRAGLLDVTPTGQSLSGEQRDALQARILEADELTDLEPADRVLLRKVAFEVAAGQSTMVNPLDWGDWVAIDAAVDADDDAALEAALDTVARGIEVMDGDFTRLPSLTRLGHDDDEEDVEEDVDLDDLPDDDSWVGL